MNKMNFAARQWILGAAALLLSPAVLAVGTEAGTPISNTATATYTDGSGNPQTVNSNTTSVLVDELLDVTLASNDAGNISVSAGDSDAVMSFGVTNTGNGEERYELGFDSTLAGDEFDPESIELYIDANGNGIFDPGVDTAYVPGSSTPPLLAADESITVFVIADIPAGTGNGDIGLVALTAESVTAQSTAGADAPGYVFAGQGDGGGSAVVGNSGGAAEAQNGYQAAQVQASFGKSQSVADPFGGSSAVQGSVITYTLVFEAAGSGDITSVLLTDNIPDNTTYRPGTLTLDGAAKTDASGDDEATFNAGTTPNHIEVDLGTVTAPATHTVTFQVEID